MLGTVMLAHVMLKGEESCPQEELPVAVEVEGGGTDQMQHIFTIRRVRDISSYSSFFYEVSG